MPVTDEKFVVLSRETWEHLDQPEELVIQDAVVIRTQDVFAGPALHMYALSIACALKLGAHSNDAAARQRLQRIGDYFHQRAEEADAQMGKEPD